MKLLFDFDGVLTDPTEEAARVAQIFREELARIGETTDEVIAGLLNMANRSLDKTPWAHGWMDQSRLSAFCNEDPFIRTNAIAACFDQWAKRESSLILSEILVLLHKRDIQSFQALASWAFSRMAKETFAGGFSPLHVESVHAVEAMIARGHEVVVVSSSTTERIVNLLNRAGFEVSEDGQSGPVAARRIRVRGDARKYVIHEEAETFAHDDYVIETNRPNYRKILLEEKPDVVIGDVFSLDLALPLSLWRQQMPGFENLRLFLRKRHYTPGWSLSACEKSELPLGVVDSIPEWLASFDSA